MNLITYLNPGAPPGFKVCVLITLPGLERPLPSPFLGDDRAEVEARATEFGMKAERFQAETAEKERIAVERRAAKKAAKKSESADISVEEPEEMI